MSFAVRDRDGGTSERADRFQPGTDTDRWRRFRVARKTLADQVGQARGFQG